MQTKLEQYGGNFYVEDKRLRFTKPLIQNSTIFFRDDLKHKIKESLKKFPELHSTIIKFGLRRGVWATAYTYKYNQESDVIYIGINTERPVKYNTLGHELTHFAQKITEIPGGEKACDVWTIARSRLFIDSPPTYLNLPAKIRNNWEEHKEEVYMLCVQAIRVRETKRQYIKWLEMKITKL